MIILTYAANIVILLLALVDNTVQWGTKQGHFTVVESEDVSNERVSIATFSSASELACSQKCLWHDECIFSKYDVRTGICELLQKISREDFDSGTLLSKKEEPQVKEASSCSLKKAQVVTAINAGDVNSKNRRCSDKDTYKSCTEALSANCFHHAFYHICLQGFKTSQLIECKLHIKGWSIAVFHHDNEKQTAVQRYEAPGSYRVVFNYSIPLDFIVAVINQSKSCSQFTKADCFDSAMTKGDSDYTWLSGRLGQNLKFWGGGPSDGKGCLCGIHKSCVKTETKCNCDSNDGNWRSDKGQVRRKDVLPITAINVGDTGDTHEEFRYTVGPLYCNF